MIKKLTFFFLFILILCTQFSIAEEKFLSLKKNKVNVRYGPSFDFEIKYIYKKINLPLKQKNKKESSSRNYKIIRSSKRYGDKTINPIS